MSKIKKTPFVAVEHVLALRNAAIELERERNELAAQVERLRDALGKLAYMAEHEAVENDIVVYQALHRAALKARAVMNEAPAQSQTAMKADWGCPTIENGKNRYGLDVGYFRDLFNRELNRSLENYRPDELARNLLRMARTADESVIKEAEFTGELKAEWQAEHLTELSLQIGLGKQTVTPSQIAIALLDGANKLRQHAQEIPAKQTVTSYSGLLTPENLAQERKELESIYGKQQKKGKQK